MSEVNWTDEQKNRITQAIEAEIENSRLAHKLIPEFKLSPNDRAVAWDRYIYPAAGAPGRINEMFLPLNELQESFDITKLQAEEPDLARVLTRVRRAAQQLARRHDEAMFRFTIRDDLDANAPAPGAAAVPGYHNLVPVNEDSAARSGRYGDGLAAATSAAVAALDGEGYRSSFAMVAGHEVYRQLHERTPGSADLPVKAVKGLLEDGPVHRSAVLPPDEALILSLSGDESDRAVAVPPTLEFLRIGANENREFRLYERFLPRFKQTYAAVLLRLVPAPARAPARAPAQNGRP